MVGTVIGKYRLVGSLGRGATGVVYRAVDQTLGRDVAVKILSSEVAESELLKRFRAEATALAKLNHPGIATIYELFSAGPDLLMVMEFVPGQTLDHLSDREGPMAPARAVHFVDRILSALEHAHRAGIVHRDMKPANVMVSHAGDVKIMDFGIARVRGVEHITVDGCLMGTPAYMSPEHVRGEPVDERADLYAAGVIFYRLLTGRLPFDADSTVIMLQKHVSERPTALRAHRRDLPPWCDSIVQRAMAKRPAERFQTASEFRTALRRASDLAPHASRSGHPGGVEAERPLAAGRTRKTTMVLSRRAATAIRKSVRQRRVAVPHSALVAAILLLLLVQVAHSPATTRVAGPVEVTSAAVLAPPPAVASPRVPASPHALASPALASPRVLAPPATAAAHGPLKRPAKPQAVVSGPARKTYPALAFATKGLVESGANRQVRDVRLVLAGHNIAVTDDATREELQMVPYEDISAIIYTHGRDPMSNSSDGPARIVRTGGRFSRVLGISARHHWISLTRTDGRVVILRVTDSQVGGMLSALEERTGRTPQLLESRKGD